MTVIPKLVRKIEAMSHQKRLSFNRLFNLFFPLRMVREKVMVRRLNSMEAEPLFSGNRSDGYSRISVDRELTRVFVDFAAKAKANYLSTEIRQKNNKEYLKQIWNLSEVDQDSVELLDWALSEPVLKAVSNYLGGKFPRLHDISVLYSPASPPSNNEAWQGSQLFHMDGGGTQCVKLWLLCQDVEESHGPTVLVSAQQSSRLAKKIGYRPGKKIKDDTVVTDLEPLETFVATGKRGDWFFTDTDRCFHYGSRTTENSDRLVIQFHFIDQDSTYCLPILSRNYRGSRGTLSDMAVTRMRRNGIAKEALRFR